MHSINKMLANIAVARQNAANFHWNVKSPFFWQFHKITEKLYEGLTELIDQVSEKISMQGQIPVSTYKEYLELSDIKEIAPKFFSAEEVVNYVIANLTLVLKSANQVHEDSIKNNMSNVIQPLLDEIFLFIDKQRWIFQSHKF